MARFAELGPRFAIQATDVPVHKPIIRRILADAASHVYVVVQEQGVGEGPVIDVFRHDGVFLDRVKTQTVPPQRIELRSPAPSPAPFVTDTHLYAVEYGSFDVPYVVRYRFVRPEAP